jgi:hypothetical protein
MGARIVLCDPHRAVVVGPTELRAAPMVSPDIRAGMALIGAELCARGTSTIMNAHQVDRGYERFDERLRSLGARASPASRAPDERRSPRHHAIGQPADPRGPAAVVLEELLPRGVLERIGNMNALRRRAPLAWIPSP